MLKWCLLFICSKTKYLQIEALQLILFQCPFLCINRYAQMMCCIHLFVCLLEGVNATFKQYFSNIVAVSFIDGGNR